ncbi:MAG: dicarboxylate/amino acid:cation symporter [Candidatus Krumholzibacteria bacterium]|nr:dicarboxylate/amino acid:cation symporter [Candidatus Krumholzibacteria bacterium]
MNMLKSLARTKLHTKILIGLIIGIPVGLLLGPRAETIRPIGDLFIRLIWMIVVPLVFSSIFVGTASLGDIRKLGRIGARTISYYLVTTAIAITFGLILAGIFKPGMGLQETAKTQLLESYKGEASLNLEMASKRPNIVDTLIHIVPRNPFESLTAGDMLQVIFFAIMFGIAATMIPGGKGKVLIDFFDAVSDGMTQLVHIIMKFAPIGVCALIAAVVGRFGAQILLSLVKYALVVLAGLAIHMGLIYSLAVRIFARMNPQFFFRGARPAQIIAFTTSSSNATLPVTIECAEENLGVSKDVASFVLPLGATINMDGTALYQGVASVFIAQVYGIPLTVLNQITIVLMATLASIGTAGVPSVGIITLTMVMRSVGLPLEGIALILGVDRILDMCRTIVNVTGDLSAAVIVSAAEGTLRRTDGKT